VLPGRVLACGRNSGGLTRLRRVYLFGAIHGYGVRITACGGPGVRVVAQAVLASA